MNVVYKLNGREISQEEFASGGERRLREMLESRQAPMSNSDREFLEGKHRQFEEAPHVGDWYKRQAEAQGVCVTGKVYLSGLAAYPGDPRAWVGGRGDVQRVCEERGWNCRGSVEYRAPEREPPPAVPIDPELVENELLDITDSSPEPLSAREVEDLREKITDARTPHWAK